MVIYLSQTLDTVPKQEDRQLADPDRSFIKGQKHTLLSERKACPLRGARRSKNSSALPSRAYLLEESLGPSWEYQTEGGARRIFENRKASGKW
ncbi:MAG: hypothetical protein KC588_05520 [Nitrospira sp.]|nr:hypothetical protein [Nitrospira sp.]